jgi:hypothetical protein
MSRHSRPVRATARASLTLCLALLVGSTAAAQAPESAARTAAEPAAAAAPAEQPRRKRDRRRQGDAAPTAAAPASVAATGQGNEGEIICKDIKPIGSRIPRRVCGTEAQWGGSSEETAAHAQEQMRQIRDRSTLTGPSPSGPASVSAPTRF